MIEEPLDRHSAEQAEGIMSALCPSKSEQRVVLGQLLRSINVAEQYAPNSWAVTLFGNGFRLNLGPVEATRSSGARFDYFCLASCPSRPNSMVSCSPPTFIACRSLKASLQPPFQISTVSLSHFSQFTASLCTPLRLHQKAHLERHHHLPAATHPGYSPMPST